MEKLEERIKTLEKDVSDLLLIIKGLTELTTIMTKNIADNREFIKKVI